MSGLNPLPFTVMLWPAGSSPVVWLAEVRRRHEIEAHRHRRRRLVRLVPRLARALRNDGLELAGGCRRTRTRTADGPADHGGKNGVNVHDTGLDDRYLVVRSVEPRDHDAADDRFPGRSTGAIGGLEVSGPRVETSALRVPLPSASMSIDGLPSFSPKFPKLVFPTLSAPWNVMWVSPVYGS